MLRLQHEPSCKQSSHRTAERDDIPSYRIRKCTDCDGLVISVTSQHLCKELLDTVLAPGKSNTMNKSASPMSTRYKGPGYGPGTLKTLPCPHKMVATLLGTSLVSGQGSCHSMKTIISPSVTSVCHLALANIVRL